jgi:hypothetical protein
MVRATRATRAKHKTLKAHADAAALKLNDLIMGTDMTVTALDVVLADLDGWQEPIVTKIPSNEGRVIEISRSISEVGAILEEQKQYKQYEKSLVFAVTQAEDHVTSCIRIVLRAYPDRLIRGPKGGTSGKSVSLGELIKAGSKESLINSITEERIDSVIRKQPSEYLEYLGHVIEGRLSNEVVNRFCEVCATRDLIVHTQGKITVEYLVKAAGLARGKVGDLVRVDEKYFQSSMGTIKDVYAEIYDIMQNKYSEDKNVASALSMIALWGTGTGFVS